MSIQVKPGTVFVSSTCYDLIDLRAEVSQHIRDMGLVPKLSDRPESSFQVAGTEDAIATCLTNLRESETVVVVLSSRYGSIVPESFGGKISATHLEYETAIKENKPIRLYVRDKLWADYEVRNRNPGAKLSWIRDQTDEPLFDILKAHDTNGFRRTFESSVELCKLLSTDLGLLSGPAIIRQLRATGELGTLGATMTRNIQDVRFRLNYTGKPLARCKLTIGPSIQPLWRCDRFENSSEEITIHSAGNYDLFGQQPLILKLEAITWSGHEVACVCEMLARDPNFLISTVWQYIRGFEPTRPIALGEKYGAWVKVD